jgi:uncharacterized protein (DUF2062 family)
MSILKRGKPRSLAENFREAVWPSMGWRRTMQYYQHRLFRAGDSTYRIAAGLATGAAVSFTPFLGTHLAMTVFITWLLRASVVAAVIGTAVGLPPFLPFIFWLDYKVGVWVCGLFGLRGLRHEPGNDTFSQHGDNAMAMLRWLFAHPLHLLLPLSVGGILCALTVWPLTYFVLYRPIRSAQVAYRLQRLKRYRKKEASHDSGHGQ